jgi:hypothetical protein
MAEFVPLNLTPPKLVSDIHTVYADGGVVNINPSPIGGTWAFCHVDANGGRIREESGRIEP